MTMNLAFLEFFGDTVTLEPYTGQDVSQAPTYGAPVSYQAQVLPYVERVITAAGREVRSSARVLLPDRLQIDPRSRITMPAGFAPLTPPILGIRPTKFQDLDVTEVLL